MNTTSLPTRKLAAGVAAVVLTFAAAGAAVAVNLGSNSGVDTPAGKLTATESVSDTTAAPAATPSTIYVDVTVPVPAAATPAPAAGQGAESQPAVTDPAASAGTSSAAAAPRSSDDHESDEHESDEHEEGSDDDD
jgi:hypothetical protein